MGLRDIISKALPKRVADSAPTLPISVSRSVPRPIISYEGVVSAENALAHPIVFRMLTTIARSVQQVRFVAQADPTYSGKGNATKKPAAGVIADLNDLLKSPNDNMTPSQLSYWMAMNFACYGRIPFKVGTDVHNFPNGIYPLEARWVYADVDERGMVVGYSYGMTTNDKSQRSPTRKVADRSGIQSKGWVHEIYLPSIAGHHGVAGTSRDVTPLCAVGLPVQVTKLLLQRAVDSAEGLPNIKYLVSTEKNLTQSQQDALAEHVEGAAAGGQESANVLFLHNTKATVTELSNDMTDIHSKIPMQDFTKMIAGAFGIPVPLLGLDSADAAKFAGNYSEARRSFWQDTIAPGYLVPMAEGLTAALCPPGVEIKADMDTIPAIEDARTTRAKDLSFVPFYTNDEKRELTDYPVLTSAQRATLVEENQNTKPNIPASTPGVVGTS